MELRLTNFPNYAIHLCPAGYSLIKKNAETGKHICENHHNASFLSLERECGIFFGDIADNEEITVLSHYTAPLLIPTEIYQKPATQYARLQFDLSDNDTLFEDAIGEYTAIYPFSIQKITQIQKAVKRPVFRHIAPFLYDEISRWEGDKTSRILVLLNDNTADFVFVQDGRLQLANQFKHIAAEDVVYHVMNVLTQHQADKSQSEILFAGSMRNGEKSEKILKKYLPQARFILR